MRYSKRILFSGLSGVVFALSSPAPESVHAQSSDFNEAENMMSFNQVELRDQLFFGLRTFLPQQQAFLDNVIAKVDSGEISRAMVNVVFVWSKKRNPKIPFPYFEAVMRLLAEKRGVTFP
ncbi:MAG: hypothetical protein NTU79_11960 [Planctomycetota bacterium]|nr:hypothetical protein [Planctomycetota bacterium]